MRRLLDQVGEFHRAFGHPIAARPTFAARAALRVELIREEFEELKLAIERGDLVAIADALGDLGYVIAGAALEFGIPLERVLEEIHRSNMSKLGADGKPITRADGKSLKGPNYRPPNIAAVLFPAPQPATRYRCRRCGTEYVELPEGCDQCVGYSFDFLRSEGSQ